MSKFIPDPQIQSLKAMRAGDISMPTPVGMQVGVNAQAFAQPIIQLSRSLVAVPSLGPSSGTPSESPTVSRAIATFLSVNVFQSKSLGAVQSLATISGTPSESPVVGVAVATSVI